MLSDSRGATSVEYLTLVGAVALLAMAAIGALGSAVTGIGGGDEAGGDALAARRGSSASGAASSIAGALGEERRRVPGTPLAGGFDARTGMRVIAGYFRDIAGEDGIIDEGDLDRAAADPTLDAPARDASRWLREDDAWRHATDTGAGRGRVDGRISREDVEAAWRELEDPRWGTTPTDGVVGEVDTLDEARRVLGRYDFLADTASGRGMRDHDVSNDDLEALARAGRIPDELRNAARVARRHAEEDCSGWSLCRFRKAAETAWTAVSSFGRGAWDSVKGIAQVGWSVAKFGGRLLTGDREAWGSVWNGLVSVVTDPVGTWNKAKAVGKAVIDGFKQQIDSCFGEGRSVEGCAYSIGTWAPDIVAAIATGGAAVTVTRAGRVASTLAKATRALDKVDDAGDAARAAQLVARNADDVADAAQTGALAVARTGDDVADAAGDATRAADLADDPAVLARGADRADCPGGNCGPQGLCFTAGTEVHSPGGIVAIEKVELGDRVVTIDELASTPTAVDATWSRVEVEMPDPRDGGDVLAIEMLRPATWVAAVGAVPGTEIHVDIDELGVEGPAYVASVGEAPAIEEGPGHVVLSTVRSMSARVLVMKFVGTSETLEPTESHPLYSLDRDAWVRAGDLKAGERLRTVHGETTIASIEAKRGVHPVYNIEVETEHSFLVSQLGVLSHNQNPCAQQRTPAQFAIEHDLFHGRVVESRPFSADANRNELFLVKISNERTGRTREALFKPRSWGDGVGWNRTPGEYVAYSVNRMLGMDYVPPVAYRHNIDVHFNRYSEGALQYMVPNARRLDAVPTGQWGTNADAFLSDTRVLDVLIHNPDRHRGNFLFGRHWQDGSMRPVLIDHGAAFHWDANALRNVRLDATDAFGNGPVQVVRRQTLTRLRQLDRASLRREVGEFLSDGEIDAMLSRRDGMVRYFDNLIRERGEAAVLVD